MFDALTPGVIIISVISLVILILWEQPFIKKLSFTKIVPGPLVAVVLGIILTNVFRGMGSLEVEAEHLVSLPVSDSISGFFGQFSRPDFSQFANMDVYVVAFTIAVVASLETLLSVEATDKMDPQKRVTPTNRELLAQGAGNMVSGLLGGLPITQVIVRSSANIQNGGRTKLSAIIHGCLLLVCTLAIPNILNMIPMASLACVLLVIGYKLAKPALFKDIYSKGLSQFIPYVITILGIVFTNLLYGIALGLVVAFMQILWINFKTPYHYDPDSAVEGEPVKIQLSEDVSFLNKAGILHTLNMLKDGTHVIIDTSRTQTIHYDVIEILDDFKQGAKNRDIKVEFIGLERLHKKGSMSMLSDVVVDEKG